MTTRLLVTGARDWTNDHTIYKALDAWTITHGFDVTIVHGGCPTGADAIADKWAYDRRRFGVRVERHPANWPQHGKAAGPLRNIEMVDLGADACYAFIGPHSKGTIHCRDAARAAGIPVTEWFASSRPSPVPS